MLNVKFFDPTRQGIEPRSTDYKADARRC